MKVNISKLISAINKMIVVLLLLLSVFNIVAPLFIVYSSRNPNIIHYFELHHTIRRLLSFIILIVAWKLYKRVSAAWTIVMLVLSFLIFHFLLLHHHRILNPMFLMELICFIVLLLSKNYYCRRMDRYSIKRGIFVYSLFAVFVVFNAAIALLKDKGIAPFGVCFRQTVDVILGLDNQKLLLMNNEMYQNFIFWFSWSCIFTGLILVLTPLISERMRMKGDIEKARELVKKYGQNCSSYLTLENDKYHFFGKTVEGFMAYGIVRDTLVVLGEPICNPEDFTVFLTEIKNFCDKNAYNLLILYATSVFLKDYEKLGMGITKCGEEPRFHLNEYSLAGGKASKIRLNINHATKAGLKIYEYKPTMERNPALEKEIMEVSQEWLSMKKSGELVFTMGGIGFENPMDRRYFYAVNLENKIEGFIVFVPFAGMNGYMTDVTRQRKNATRGVMEKIFYEAMMTFKEEGIEWGSMSIAPLARLEQETVVTARLLHSVYEKMNHVYGFKTLYQTKVKYNPTYWEPAYFVYSPPVFSPAMAYAIVKIQNPKGITDYIKAFFRNRSKDDNKSRNDNEVLDHNGLDENNS